MFVKDVVGEGITTQMSMACGDLGIMRWDNSRNCIAAMFGDNFSEPNLTGTWNGPSIVLYDADYNPEGIPSVNDQGFKSIGVNMPVQSLWSTIEHTVDPPSTTLPTDFIWSPSTNSWIVSVMLTAGLGNELTTQFHTSTDLYTWNPNPILTLTHPSHPGNVLLTFDQIGNTVYIFGTGGLARNKPVWLWRCPANDFPLGYWEPYGHDDSAGWQWGTPNEATPILLGSYGELCFRSFQIAGEGSSPTNQTQQTICLLSYFDAGDYCTSILMAASPEELLYNSTKQTFSYGELPSFAQQSVLLDTPINVTPNLYGPYISPLSQLNTPNGVKLFLSQWNNTHYKVSLHQTTLFIDPSKEG